jgi:hypothetical protein
MHYQENTLKKSYKLTFFILIGLMVTLAKPAFAFDKMHHKSSDADVNFQVRIQDDKNLCSGSLLSRTIVITSKHCLGSDITVYYNNQPYGVKEIHQFGALKSDQKLRADKTAHEDLAILELQKAVVGDNINFVKIPTINQERAAFANKTALTLFGFWGDPHQFIFGYADKYPYIGELYYSFDSLIRKIRPAKNCPEGEGVNDGSYFCIQPPAKAYQSHQSLTKAGDNGGAVTFKKNNEYYILGVINASNYYPRLGSSNIREWLNQFYVELNHWSDFNSNKKAKIGDLYVYNNPYDYSTEYFGLIRLNEDKAYGYFPTDRTHNPYWVYLGDTTPQDARNKFDMILSMNHWGQNDRKGKIGDNYVYVNYYDNSIDVFILKAVYSSDNRYWHFPTDQQDNYFWSYIGSFDDYIKNKKLKYGSTPKVETLPKRPEIQRPKVGTLPIPLEVETLAKKHISI